MNSLGHFDTNVIKRCSQNDMRKSSLLLFSKCLRSQTSPTEIYQSVATCGYACGHVIADVPLLCWICLDHHGEHNTRSTLIHIMLLSMIATTSGYHGCFCSMDGSIFFFCFTACQDQHLSLSSCEQSNSYSYRHNLRSKGIWPSEKIM